ncbi:PKD-like domain-containing protein [Flavobacterium sp. GB2R13]|uniref:PKD-like domain-containing protein n=1 Tax=Flavobacterium algoris TaxID=3398733 RepID=UPI003A869740
MKKKYLFIILLSLNSLCSFGQDCITEKIISDPTICLGENAIITLFNSETGMDYQLRIGTTDIGSPVTGLTGTDIPFSVSPSTTTIYNVIASSGAICTITYSDVATVTVNPLPIVSAGSNSPQCAGSTLNLTASGGISYSWTGPNGFTSTSQNPSITNVTTAASGTYTVTVTDANSCFNTATVGVTVNTLLVPSVNIGVNPGNNICAGTSVTFTATPVNGGTTPIYQWKINGVNVGINSPTFTTSSLVNTDKVTVVLTSNATCPSLTKVTSNVITMTVNDIVIPSVSISSSATTICPGNSINFSAIAINGGSTPSYQWMINGFNAGINSPNFSTSSFVNGDIVTVELTSNAACSSPTTAISNPITITVNPATPATPAAIIGTTPVCPGVTTLTYDITPVLNATTYTWTVPAGWSITAGAGTNSITVTSGSTGQNGNISVTAGNSCGTSATRTLAVTVSPATPATPGAITGIVKQCPAVTGQIYSIAVVTNATTYNWTIPTGWAITAGTGTNSITVTSGNTGQNGNISVTAENSCGTSATRTLAVTVAPTTPATPGSITGTVTQCPALTGQIYSIAAVTNATTYTWTVPIGWSITAGAGTNSITVTSGNAGQNGTISVTAGNSCGTSSANTLAVTVSPATPTTPGAIAGTSSACPGITGLTYSIAAVTNATTYNWTVPTGWSITAGTGTNSITVTSGSTGQNGTISVTAENSCGTSAAKTLAVTVNPATPVTPGAITGTVTQCPALTGQIYSITAVTNATTYIWTVPTGWSITAGAGTNSITVTSGSVGQNGNISVTAGNSCGTSVANSLAVTISPVTPATPGVISGTSPVCPSITGLTYSITAVANATTYTWTVPTGWSITAGTNTNSITVTSGTAGQNGNISVTAGNSCGTSAAKNLAVTVSQGTPGTPGAISGSTEQCISKSGLIYNITAVPNATSYTWTLPSGWSITAGVNTNSITVSTSGTAVGGNITVTATNSCGTSSAQTFAVTVNTAIPVTPAIPTSPQSTSVCPVVSGLQYSVTAVANATSYTWTLPTGWIITAGSGTNSITVTASSSAVTGNISVKASNACGSSASSANLLVTVGNFAFVDAGVDQVVCAASPDVSLSPTTGGATGNNNVVWSSSNGGSFSPNANKWNATYTPGAAAITAGTVTLTITSDDPSGSCTAVSDQMIVTITPIASIASVTGISTLCSSATTTYTANSVVLSGGIGAWSSSNTAVATVNSSGIVTGIAAGNCNIIYTITGGCGGTKTAFQSITINAAPTVNAGGPNVVCQSATPAAITLAGASVGGGATTGAWSIISGGGLLSSTAQTATPATVTYTPAANFSGTVTLTLTTNAPSACSVISATRTITINAAPTVNAGGPDVVCQSATPSAITLAGSSVGGGATTGAWSITSGGGLLSSTAQTATPATVTYTPAANFSGTVTLTLTTNTPSACSVVSATRTITINTAPTVNAGGPDVVCQSATPAAITLAGSSVGGGATTGAWSITSGGGLLSSTAQTATPATVTYTPAANFSGTVTLTLTTNAPSTCSVISATRTITINTAPTVNAGGPDVICQSATPAAIILAGATLGGGATTGAWSITSGGGLLSSTAQTATPATVTYTPAANFSGTVTLTLTTNAPSACSLVSATRTITINAAPTVNAGGPDVVCQSATPAAITLAGATLGGGATTGIWSITSGGGLLSSTAQTATPATVTYTPAANFSGTVTLTLTTNAPSACSVVSATRTITINAAPTVNAGGPDVVCQSATPAAITLAGATLGGGATTGAWSITSGGGLLSSTAQTATPATVTYTPAPNFSGTVTLTLTTNAPSTCSVVSATRAITIDSAPTVNAGSDLTICSNTTATMAGSFGGSATSATWSTSGSGTFNNNTPTAIYTPSAADISTGIITLTYTTNDPIGPCPSVNATIFLTIKKAAVITTQPSNTSICASFPVNLSVVAIGDGLTYQWYKGSAPSGTPVANSANISGAQSTNLHFNQANLTDDGYYYVIVGGASPCASVTSAQRTLNVDQAIIVSTQPVSQALCTGSNVTFTVVADANGDPLSFQWRKNGINISGATSTTTSSTLTINNSTAADAANYDVLISGPIGYTCSSVQSAVATLTVNPLPTISGTLNVCESSTTQLSGSAAPAAVNPWLSSNTLVASVSNNGLVTGITAGTAVITYSNSNGCKITATILVNPTPSALATNATQTICSAGTITTIAFSGNVAATTYNWTRNNTVTVTGIPTSGTGDISGSLTNSTNAPVTVTFTITPTANGCPGTPITATVLVNPTPNAVATPALQTICSASAITTIALSGSVASTTYNWTRNNTVAVTGIVASGSGNISGSLINSTNTPITVTFNITPTANGCPGTPITATVLVNPTPNAVATPASQMICSASAITAIVLSGNVASTTFNWTRDNTVAVTGILASGSGNISGTLTNTTNAAVTVTFTITPTSNGCPGLPITATILVNPTPNAIPTQASQTICSASAITTIALSGSVTASTFNWTRNNTATVNGIAASGSGNISGNLTNTTNAPVTVTFTITPTANGCPGTPITATVLVNPTPNVVATPASQTICSASVITAIVLSGNVASTTFNWTRDNTVAVTGILASGSGNISGTLTNTTNAAVTVTFTITPTSNGCPGLPITATIVVAAPSIGGVVTFSSGAKTFTDCHSASGTVALSGQIGIVDRWQSSTDGGNTWSDKGNAGNTTYTYTAITTATLFRAVVKNGLCAISYSDTAILFIIPNIKPTPVSASPSTICEGESTTLISLTSFSSSQALQNGGLFNTAQPPGWYVDGGNFNASGDNGKNHTFSETNGNAGDEYNSVDKKFAIVRGNLNSIMETPIFDLIGLTTANLTFDSAYKLNNGAWGKVDLSFDGGLTYPTNLANYSGNQAPYNVFNTAISLNLDAYLGYNNLRIRFSYHGTEDRNLPSNVGSSWALDNIKIPQTPVPALTSDWKDLGTGAIISIANSTNVTVTPPVTTTYEVTSYLNGCRSYGSEGTTLITVTVNKRPTANIGVNQTICYDGTANFNITLTGKAPWIITYSNGTTPTTVTYNGASPYLFSVSNIKANCTYTVTNLSDANCTVALPQGLIGAATVTVLTGTPGIWTGLVSTDWFDCKNWEQGLPSLTIDAQIPTNPSGGPRMPVIDRTSPFASLYNYIASARDIIIANSASVTMVNYNNSELQISRDWKNSGAFIPGTGTVTFNGYTSNQIQNINLGIKAKETYYNLTTNNSGGAKGISVIDGFELTVLNNLSLLSGDLRLTGEAQLIQAGTATNPTAGTGYLLRDQQGQRNSFNYNYWSSPVSLNNTNYSVGSVLRDGTDITNVINLSNFNQEIISFGDGAYFADGSLSNPVKISNRWIWSYNSLTPDSNTDWDNYYQWNYIGSTGVIRKGEGFTMKGTDGTSSLLSMQNYVFVGKPNSGTVALNISLDQTYLIGNPYPSSLDADEFIKDNLKDCTGCRASANIFSGALYFWDHFGLTSNHFLAEYVGGYGTYTLMGGLVAIADDPLNVNNGSTGTKIPKRYIPVAQGFFVDASLDPSLAGTATTVQGGTLNFKNSQRAFIRESSGNSIFMKQSVPKKMAVEQIDPRSKIRLSLVSALGINRQLLVGVDSNTTNEFDIGYDAPMLEIEGDNIYWEFSNSKFVIQGVPDFNDDQIIPIGLTIANEGLTTIKIDALENVPETTKIYLYDNISGNYHDMKNSGFAIPLAVGEYNNRFSLRFTNKTLGIEDNTINDGILILYSNNYKVLIIQNKVLDTMVKEVHLFNLLGQDLTKWDVENIDQTRIQIPIKNLSSGVYIVKLKTSKGDYNKKIIIK